MAIENAQAFPLADKGAWRRVGIVLLILGAAPLSLLLVGADPLSLFTSFVFVILGALLAGFPPSMKVDLRNDALRFTGPAYMFRLPNVPLAEIEFVMKGDLSDVGAGMLTTRQVGPWLIRTGILVRRKDMGFNPLRRPWMLFRVEDEAAFLQAAAAAGIQVRTS